MALPAFASCAQAGAAPASSSSAAAILMPAMLARLPATRLLAGRLVQIDDDLPDLLLAQPVFPRRHHRVPRRRLLRQAGTTLGDAPEEVGLLEHRDRAGVLEVGGRGIEAGREVALAVEVVAVTVHAVADVDLAPLRRVLLEPGGVLAQRVLGARDVELLALELDRRGRRRVDGAQLGRRLRPGRGLGEIGRASCRERV